MGKLTSLGLSALIVGGGVLLYKGVIEDHGSQGKRQVRTRMGSRFTLTSDEGKWDRRVSKYQDSCLQIPGLNSYTSSSTSTTTCKGGLGLYSGKIDNSSSTGTTISKEQLKSKCESMITEDPRDGFREIHWALFRYWCSDDNMDPNRS